MNERDDLHAAFRAMLDHPEPAAVDRRQAVGARITRIRRQRAAAAGLSAVVLLGGAGVVFTQVRNHEGGGVRSTQTLQAPQAPQLAFTLSTKGRSVTIDAKLSGKGQSPDRYGWKVAWGDTTGERAYGTSNCSATTPVDSKSERIFSHKYTQPGTYTIVVETTLCGVVQARASAKDVVR